MLADCDRCALRDLACGDCVISVLPGGQAGLGEEERRALRVLAAAGLVPPLRFSAASAPGGTGRRHGAAAGRAVSAAPGLARAKTGPRVGEPVETVLAVH